MALEPGTRLGNYKVISSLGAGGMGEVYLAEDTKLGREVAIKILPEAFTKDPERLARFEREARVLASLNHSNIAAIYEVGEAETEGSSCHYLAMELAPGVELGERLGRGPMGVDEALPIARQIAEGLEAAHGRGITHRDLKPSNIKIAADGDIKILDFGLAKAWEGSTETSADLTASPTLTARMTQAGVILGTPAYMSPEQARGEEADQRADIWSFGVILWEMLTGRRLFAEPTVSDTLAAVLRADLDLDSLPADTPWNVRRALERCLERDPKSRYHSVADARIELLSDAAPPAADGQTAERRRLLVPLAAAATVALIAGAWLGRQLWPVPDTEARPTHLSILVADIVADWSAIAITPDGRSLVYAGAEPRQLYHRPLGQPNAIPIPGTEGARSPFVSPDGQWVAFIAEGALRKVPLSGGTPVTLHQFANQTVNIHGGAWSTDGTLYMGLVGTKEFGYSTLVAIPEQGGEPRVLIPMIDDEGMPYERFYPQLLPGEDRLLFTRLDGNAFVEHSKVMVLDLATGVEAEILDQHGFAIYLPSGHLMAISSEDSFALMPFDSESLRITGAPVPIRNLIETRRRVGLAAHLAVTQDGTVVFERASPDGGGGQLVWLGLDGNTTEIPVAARDFGEVSLSHDGTQAALTIGPDPKRLWTYDFERQVLSAVTSHPAVAYAPVWMPDDRSLVFASGGDAEPFDIFLLALDSGEPARRLAETGTVWTVPWDVSPDGKTVAAFIWDPVSESDWDTILIPTDGSAAPESFSSEDTDEYHPRFSPDGRWIAFVSDRTGANEIYLKRFPEQGPLIQVTDQGAWNPSWAPDGSRLYFVAETTSEFMAVDIIWNGTPSFSRPQFVFQIPARYQPLGWAPWAGKMRDAERLLVIRQSSRTIEALDVILDWSTELERLAPTGR